MHYHQLFFLCYKLGLTECGQFKNMRAIFIVLILLLASSATHAESPEVFTLISKDSSVQFLISSTMFPLEGKIERYSGKLIKTGKLPGQFELSLDCDVSSTKITGEALQGLPISQLLASVKNSTAHFEGKPVSRKIDGTFNIGGTLKWKGKSYGVSFPLKVNQNGSQWSLEGKMNGSGEQLVEELPMLQMFQIQNASANAKLVFKKLPINLKGTS